MSTLFKLREWVTVAAAAQHLSTVWSETVSEADVLQLALDGRLTLSVDFVNGFHGWLLRVVPREQGTSSRTILRGNRMDRQPGRDYDLSQSEVLQYAKPVRYVFEKGVWDLPLLGNGRLDVVRRLQALTGGPNVTVRDQAVGVLVNQPKGTWFKLGKTNSRDGAPADTLPDDAYFVVRRAALHKLEQTEPASKIETAQEPPDDLVPFVLAADDLGSAPQARSSDFLWQNVKICYLNEHTVQITIGDHPRPPQSYDELGFADGRTKKPNGAWPMLQEFCRHGGTIEVKPTGGRWAPGRVAIQKRIQALRKILRKGFNTDSDPVPFVSGEGYKTAFRLDSGPAFHSDSGSGFNDLH